MPLKSGKSRKTVGYNIRMAVREQVNHRVRQSPLLSPKQGSSVRERSVRRVNHSSHRSEYTAEKLCLLAHARCPGQNTELVSRPLFPLPHDSHQLVEQAHTGQMRLECGSTAHVLFAPHNSQAQYLAAYLNILQHIQEFISLGHYEREGN